MNRNKMISVVLSVLMVFSTMPIAAFAQNEEAMDGALKIDTLDTIEDTSDLTQTEEIDEDIKKDLNLDVDLPDDINNIDNELEQKTDEKVNKKASKSQISFKKNKKKKQYIDGEVIVMYDVSTNNIKKSAKDVVGDDVVIESSLDFGSAKKLNTENIEASNFEVVTKKAKESANKRRVVSLVKSSKYSTKQLLKIYKSKKDIIEVQPNYKVHALQASSFSSINDQLKSYQWALNNTGQNAGKAGEDIQIDSAWNKNTGSEKVVAIVDTGVDLKHEDLKDNLWTNPNTKVLKGLHGYDFVNGDDNPQDDDGHGSHVAGIIGAKANNSVGISGVNQNIKIMALKFLDATGSGSTYGAMSAYNYIYKAQSMGVDVVAVNNSWGGEADEEEGVLGALIDLVGENGAVSLCASGNEYTNTDESYNSPSCIDSDYIISVAAGNEKGKLAEFSNYGTKTVDVAAPGVDILSSVSYPCYNPSIYNSDGLNIQSSASQKYESFDGSSSSGVTVIDASSNKSSATLSTNCTDEYFGKNGGKSVSYKLTGASSGDTYKIAFRYNASDGADTKKMIKDSILFKAKIAPFDEYNNSSLYDFYDIPYSKLASCSLSEDSETMGMTDGNSDDWVHNEIERKASFETDRCLVFIVEIGVSGDFEFYFDDFGVSKPYSSNKEAEEMFKKYDIYSGTSMATPYVTGYAAMVNQNMGFANGKDRDVKKLVDVIKASTRDLTQDSYSADKTIMQIKKGNVDFSYTQDNKIAPVINSVSKVSGQNQIIIKGNCFGTSKGNSECTVEYKIQSSGPHQSDATIISWKDDEIIISSIAASINLINRGVTFKVKRNGKTDSFKTFLKNTSNNYKVIDNTDLISLDGPVDKDGSTVLTDGKDLYVYLAGGMTEGSSINFGFFEIEEEASEVDPGFFKLGADEYYDDYDDEYYDDEEGEGGSDFEGWTTLTPPDVVDMFEESKYSGDDKLEFITNLAYSNGYFYAIANRTTGYTNEYKVVRYKISTDEWQGFLDIDINNEITNYKHSSLAIYNGKLYVVGGYDEDSGKATTMVRELNLSTKKWSGENNASLQLPTARYASNLKQVGKYLVATFGGNNEGTVPYIAIYDGKKWVEDKQNARSLYPSKYDALLYPSETPTDIFEEDPITGEKEYFVEHKYYNIPMGISGNNTLVFTGNNVENLGDTFKYTINSLTDFSKNKFESISNYSSMSSDEDVLAQSVGNKFYALTGNDMYEVKYMPITTANLTVKASVSGSGSIQGAGQYLPGQVVTLKAVGKKNKTYPTSLTVDGKKQKGYSYTGVYGKNIIKNTIIAKANFNNYVKKLSISKKSVSLKRGNSMTLKLKFSPSTRISKKVKWSSSKSSVVSVSKSGKITAKKKGSATITVMSLDGKKAKAKCKVTVK